MVEKERQSTTQQLWKELKKKNLSGKFCIVSIISLISAVILTTIPLYNFILNKNIKMWNGTILFDFWMNSELMRFRTVYILNVTNPQEFLNGAKPNLVEVGPFVYRLFIDNINIKSNENLTISYQQRKTFKFIPEMSADDNQQITTLNIPLLSVTSETKDLGMLLKKSLSLITTTAESKPFISLTPNELLFGYNDTLTYIAHMVYPRNLRPNKKMGLLNGAHERLSDVRTMSTGLDEHKNGYFQRVAGLKTFHVWDKSPCNDLNASDGFFFPHSDLKKKLPLFLYEEDMCRMVPLEYSKNNFHKGILTYEYVVPKGGYGGSNIGNQCYNPKNYNAPLGLQPVAPCHYGISIYISQPHFYQADPRLLDAVVGLKPSRELHQTIFKIQPTAGIPVQVKFRLQLNLKIDHVPEITVVSKFRDFMFPIVWMEDGIDDVSLRIKLWLILGMTLVPLIYAIAIVLLILGLLIIFIMLYCVYRETKKDSQNQQDPLNDDNINFIETIKTKINQ